MDTAELVREAGAGDQFAWRELVDRFSGLVWRVARSHRLTDSDAADVSQSTWITLAENITGLHAPDRLPAWLVTTARRESLRVIADRARVVVSEAFDDVPDENAPETTTLRTERDDLLWRAFATLPERCRTLLGLVAFAPGLSYARMARAIGVAPGSIGNTKGRCLDTLRRTLAVFGMPEEVAG
ncbi:putative RNA polymerase sigma factor [Alloactinosynnema sp. L-07]|uniref:RNA polymerase sigma factor n=1 Tax=Alloactinosynnema sp. L-07 TaxID=1653480 RepID=UPI00065F021E|nr:sigma-70 family RNA polymerase sigma factor [Alloactinosynnema sp. L-07]CRK60298.1 putative RNA polymerase sigma factor [Alloactinosynnema sp. L-07]